MTKHDDHRAEQKGEVERVRWTALRPVVWMTSVLVWAAVVALIVRVPTWASLFLCTITGVSFLVFLVGYIYLFVNDRESLRAERWRPIKSGATPRDVRDQPQESLAEDRSGYLGPARAEVLLAQPEQAGGKVRVDAGTRKAE